jgi:GNAT superfamily N-acetyltransferase
MSRADVIRRALTPDDVAAVRGLFEAYAASLDVDLCFQGFAAELVSLPGAYAPPRGALFVAGPAMAAVGCVALRPLATQGASATAAELKRLYVRPEGRGAGLGVALVHAAIDAARAIGYREILLDTLPSMTAARALYAALGFVPCDAYYPNPVAGTAYLRLALD